MTWFLGLLFLLLFAFRLSGIIDWPWLWVTAPLWGPLALLTASAIVGILLLSLLALARSYRRRTR